jgi:hypothetical protein
MLSIITLPTDFVTQTTANATSMLSDLSPVTTLILGVLLAVTVIGIILGFFHK